MPATVNSLGCRTDDRFKLAAAPAASRPPGVVSIDTHRSRRNHERSEERLARPRPSPQRPRRLDRFNRPHRQHGLDGLNQPHVPDGFDDADVERVCREVGHRIRRIPDAALTPPADMAPLPVVDAIAIQEGDLSSIQIEGFRSPCPATRGRPLVDCRALPSQSPTIDENWRRTAEVGRNEIGSFGAL